MVDSSDWTVGNICFFLLRFGCFWCFSIIAAYLFLIFFSIHTSVCSALIPADYIVPCCFLIIPWWQQELPFFVFGYLLNKCIMSSAMGRRYSFITYLFLQMCTWHIFLFPASGIRPSYTRHLISGSRHRFFMIFIRSWCHMGLLLYSSHSSQHGHMVLCITQSTSSLFYRLLFVIYHLHLSVAYFYPAARNRIFFTRRLTSGSRRVAFIKLFLFFNDMPSFCILFPFAYCLIMPAARDKIFFRKKTNFRQQAWSLPILFLCLSFMTDVFSFTVISLRFHLLFIYIVRNWYIRLFSLLTSTYCLLLCTDCCRKLVFFWILSLITAAALALLICMNFSFAIFALISYRWYFIFITPKFFLFSCICIIYNWYLFLFHRNFACFLFYLYHLWLAYLLLLLILLHRLLLCTDCCRKSVFFLDIITYHGSSSCSALSTCTVFLSLMSDVLIHSVHDI